MATSETPSFIHPASTMHPVPNQSPPQQGSSSRQQSCPREVLDLTFSDDTPYPGTTTASGSSPGQARSPATGPIFDSPNLQSQSDGSGGHEVRLQRAASRQLSSSPTQSPMSSPASTANFADLGTGGIGRGAVRQMSSSPVRSPASSTAATKGRGRRGRPPSKPFGGRRTAEEWEAEKAAKRAKYVPRPRGTPKTAMFLNPDYNAYSHLQERPLGVPPCEKDKFDRTIIRKNELFCRVKNEATGELCKDTARMSGTGAVTRHVQSGKHNLPIAPMAYLGNVADERADNAKFYKDVMARHRELGGPESVYSEKEMQCSPPQVPPGFSPAAAELLSDRLGGAAQLPGFFPGAAARETVPAAARVPPEHLQGMMAADAANNPPPPYAAHDPAKQPAQPHQAVKRKRTEAECELRNVKKDLQRTEELRQEAEAEVRQLREENDELYDKLHRYEPEIKRRKITRKEVQDEESDEDAEGTAEKRKGVKAEVKVKTEENVKIKQEHEEEIRASSKQNLARARATPRMGGDSNASDLFPSTASELEEQNEITESAQVEEVTGSSHKVVPTEADSKTDVPDPMIQTDGEIPAAKVMQTQDSTQIDGTAIESSGDTAVGKQTHARNEAMGFSQMTASANAQHDYDFW